MPQAATKRPPRGFKAVSKRPPRGLPGDPNDQRTPRRHQTQHPGTVAGWAEGPVDPPPPVGLPKGCPACWILWLLVLVLFAKELPLGLRPVPPATRKAQIPQLKALNPEKNPPRRPKMASKMATLAQDGLQDGPRWPPSPPKMVQDGLQDGPRESKIPPSSPKKPPRRPKRPPRGPPGGPEEASITDFL